MKMRASGDVLLLGAAMCLALAAALYTCEQILNFATWRVVMPWNAVPWYLGTFAVLGIAAFTLGWITRFLSLSPAALALLMLAPVVEMAITWWYWTEVWFVGRRFPRELWLIAVPATIAGYFLLLAFTRLSASRSFRFLGMLLLPACVFVWLGSDPEQVLPIAAAPRYALQAAATALLFLACFWLALRCERPLRLSLGVIAVCGLATPALALLARPLLPPVASGGPRVSRLPATAPNVLWIVLDTLRRDHLPIYGYARGTAPFLSDLARESVLYENAVSPAGWTLPSHASMFTGLLPREHGAYWKGEHLSILAEDRVTIAEILRDAGYRTGAVSANLAFVTPGKGLAQGFDFFANPDPVPHFLVRADLVQFVVYLLGGDGTERLLIPYPTAGTVNRVALEWIDAQGDAPWFLFLNYMEPHRPHWPPASLRKAFPGELPVAYDLKYRLKAVAKGDSYSEAERAHFRSQYDAQVRTLDAHLEELARGLRERGLWDDLLVVLTSDHGEYLGEHDFVSHGQGLFEEVLQVPLMVRYPGPSRVERKAELTSTAEIPGILLEALPTQQLDLSAPYLTAVKGILARRRMLRDEGFFVAELYYNPKTPWKRHSGGAAVYDGRFKFVSSIQGGDELYDLESGSGEGENVIEQHPAEARTLRSTLERYRRLVPEAEGEVDEEENLRALKALGYIE